MTGQLDNNELQRLHEQGAHAGYGPVELHGDVLVELISLACDGLTFRRLNEQGHVLDLTPTGYGLEHPVSCRIQGRLLDCPVDAAIRRLHENPFGGYGRYRVLISDSGVLEGWKLP